MDEKRTEYENNNNIVSDKSLNSECKKSSNWDKYVYTICVFFNHFAFALTSNLFGPSMVDMKYTFHTSMNYIALYNTFNSIGYLTGSLFGFLYKYINRQMTLIVMITVLGVGTALVPFCPNIWTLYLCSLISQMGGGAWDNVSSVWLIEMWKHRSPAVLQFLNFMYGLGTIVGPLIAEPFLTGKLDSDNAVNSSISTTLSTITTTDINDSIDRRSKLIYPFIIGGAIQSIIPVIFLIMLFLKKYKPPENVLKIEDLSKDSDMRSNSNSIINSQTNIIENQNKNRNLLIGLTAACLGSYGSIEMLYFQYSSTYYQYIDLKISEPKAAQIMSVMATSYTIARFVSTFIAIKVKPEIMIIYHYCIIIISMIVLYFGQNHEILIWIGNAMIGVGFSAMWPAILAFADKHIKLTDRVSTIILVSTTIIPLSSPFLIGPYIEHYPLIFTILESLELLSAISIFSVLLYIVKRR